MARLFGDKEFRFLRTDLDKSLNCLFIMEEFMKFEDFLQDAKERIVDLEKWDHPRMCGNNNAIIQVAIKFTGSPPHVREQLCSIGISTFLTRITPACAGTTHWWCLYLQRYTDHPRMCGNNCLILLHLAILMGSPPHVREQLKSFMFQLQSEGITPACAGTTLNDPLFYLILILQSPGIFALSLKGHILS